MEAIDQRSMNLEQELAQKAGELAAQRRVRELQLVDLTLRRIADGVVSKEADIQTLMRSAGDGRTRGQTLCRRPAVVQGIHRTAEERPVGACLHWQSLADRRAAAVEGLRGTVCLSVRHTGADAHEPCLHEGAVRGTGLQSG